MTVTKILILAANPNNTSPLRLDQEVRAIDEGLRRAAKRELFDLEQRWAVQTDDLRRALDDISEDLTPVLKKTSTER